MFVTIIAEPRSGSTNLTNWFYFNSSFTTLFEPMNPTTRWYQNGIDPKQYRYKTEHICVKEVYYPHKDYESLIKTSDKIIILYREEYNLQLESFINALITNNWDKPYVYRIKNSKLIEEKTAFFSVLKEEFKRKYIDSDYFKISYEELYYNNNFQKIVDYLNMDCVKNENFPYGTKYRVTLPETRNLI
jgi:hypothetical protein